MQIEKRNIIGAEKKNDFWLNILTDIESMNVLVSPTTVEQVKAKWKTVYRAYKSSVDRGTGASSSKILYLEEMEEIFIDNPLMHCEHAVSVDVETEPRPASLAIASSASTSETTNEEITPQNKKPNPTNKRKTENRKENLLEIKKKYYEKIIDEEGEKRKLLEKYLENKEKSKDRRHAEILEALKKNCENNSK